MLIMRILRLLRTRGSGEGQYAKNRCVAELWPLKRLTQAALLHADSEDSEETEDSGGPGC